MIRFKTSDTKKDRKEKNEICSDLVLRAPASLRIAGIIELVIGCLLSAFCYLDYLNGNETASVGIALGFLIIPGIAGIVLVLFSSRFITVKGENIVFRDFLLRTHRYRLEDITRVQWSVDGYVFMGKTEKLFKLYNYYASCEPLFLELERRGVELDVPGRPFGSGRTAALHPCLEKRRFIVRSCNCSLFYGGKIKIEGRNLLFSRPFRKELSCTVRDLTEVRIKEQKDGRITVCIFGTQKRALIPDLWTGAHCSGRKNRRLLFKINGFAGDCQDTHFVFALARHLKESGVPLKGLENSGEGVKCLMRNRFVCPAEAVMVFKEEYERILPAVRKYETELAASGYQLMYGAADREEIENQVKELFPDQALDSAFVFGYYFCLTKEGTLVYDKKQKCALYQCSPVMTKEPEAPRGASAWEGDLKDLICFEPIPESAIGFILGYFHELVKKKKIYLSDNRFPFQDIGR